MTPKIFEEFDRSDGSLRGYHAYNLAQNNALANQRSRNIRSFVHNVDLTRTMTVLDLNAYTVEQLNAFTMAGLGGSIIYSRGERWVVSSTNAAQSISTDANFGGHACLSVTATTTAKSYESSGMVPTGSVTAGVITVNLEDDFTDVDHISVTARFKPSEIDMANTKIEFTSDPNGDFSAGPVCSLPFNTCLTPPTGTATSNWELRWLRSAIVGIERRRVTGVRITVQSTVSTAFLVAAVRLLDKDWLYAPLDIETYRGRLVKGFPRDGTMATAIAFPGAAFPSVYFADSPTSGADPRPIDASVRVKLFAGSQTGNSKLRLYFRELPLDYVTQLDLDYDGSDYTTMAELDSPTGPYKGKQPDFGGAKYANRTQADLDTHLMSEFDSKAQATLERKVDSLASAYLYAELQWGPNPQIDVRDSENNGFTLTGFTLNNGSHYLFYVEVEDEGIRLRIMATPDSQGRISGSGVSTTYNSGWIFDPVVKRRPGRLGWWASISDYDATVESIRPTKTNFAEYRSHPLRSTTSVEGATLFATASPDIQLYETMTKGPWGGNFSTDATQARSGNGFVIDSEGNALQGVQTNRMFIDDMSNLIIECDVLFPSAGLVGTAGWDVYLFGDFGFSYALPHRPLIGDRWQSLKIDCALRDTVPSGYYRIGFLQTTDTSGKWYLDSVSVRQRAIEWSARSGPQDAWGDAQIQWTPFRDAINDVNSGILFRDRGTQLQVSGKALKQSAEISKIEIKPKYAELGRFAWRDLA